MRTPWGPAQSAEPYGLGITFYGTASHGGYRLYAAQRDAVSARFPAFQPFNGNAGWYEEDQDWCVVALTFPDRFDDATMRSAARTARRSLILTDAHRAQSAQTTKHWSQVVNWLDSDAPYAKAIRGRILVLESRHADDWEPGSRFTVGPEYPLRSWCVRFTRLRDGKQRSVVLAEYPTRQFYTDAELSALECRPGVIGQPQNKGTDR